MNKTLMGKGEIDCKRFELGTPITATCPKCGTTCDMHYLSFPKMNVKETETFYCHECDHEWKVTITLSVQLQIESPDSP